MHQFQTEWKIGFSSPLILIFELCEWAIWWISPQMCLNITEVGIGRYQSKIAVDCGRFHDLLEVNRPQMPYIDNKYVNNIS